jgi:putative oxidoreductase
VSDKDDKATEPGESGPELPRFGERAPTGGFVLDPHDDSDVGIGPALPRIRGAAESSAAESSGAEPTAAESTAAESAAAPTRVNPAAETTVNRVEPAAASPLSDLITPPPPLGTAPDTAETELPSLHDAVAVDPVGSTGTGGTGPGNTGASSDDRDRFGLENNRRLGRERAAAARAAAEPASAVDLSAETEVMPKGKRFGRPAATDDHLDAARKAARRGTTDLGLLLLRVTVGLLVAAHGAQKLFGVWGGPGINGFQQFLQHSADPSVGFHQFTKVLAVATGIIELGGGVMLVIGVLTPIAASGVLGVMISASVFKLAVGGHGFELFAPKGIEYELLLTVATATILLAGPGRLSLDYGRGWSRRPAWGSAAWLLIGVAGAVVIWFWLNGANPLAKH